MNLYPAVIVMGAVEEEGTFWIQLLMVVILAAGAGIYGLFKSRAKRAGRETHDEVIETIIETPKSLVKNTSLPTHPEHRRIEWLVTSEIKPRRKDLIGGMELLARNFLAGVVERTDSPDQRDIAMRRLCFAELSRRGELWSLASAALKIYTLDEDGFYGKVIRFEAMAELAGRTRPDLPCPTQVERVETSGGAAEDSEPGRNWTANQPHNVAETRNLS